MARPEKLNNWPIMAFKYAIKPIGEIPQRLWDTAKEMQRAWNLLASDWFALHDQLRPPLRDEEGNIVRDKFGKPVKEKKEWTAEEREQWKELNDPKNLEEKLKQFTFNWECRRELIQRYLTTCSRISKGGGPPKKHYRLESISIPHMFYGNKQNGGGLIIDNVFDSRSKRLSLKAIDAKYTGRTATTGYFGFDDGTQLDMKVYVSRRIPAGAFIKKVTLVGERTTVFDWEWSIVFTCDVPPSNIQYVKPDKVCGLDLGWRKFDDYIRIGMIIDSEGKAIELCLPINQASSSRGIIRFNKHFNSKGVRAGLEDVNLIHQGLDEIISAESQVGTLIEDCKTALAHTLPKELPEEVAKMTAHIKKMRQWGLIRLLRALEQAGCSPQSQQIIRGWRERNNLLERRIQGAEKRLVNKRKWLYYNIVNWLCKSYGKIAWEGDLKVKNLIERQEKEEKNYALEIGAKYRQYAAIGDFREKLKRVAAKYGTELVNCKRKETTSRCVICGGIIEKSPRLVLSCKNGHRIDTDINSAAILLGNLEVETARFNYQAMVIKQLRCRANGEIVTEEHEMVSS